MWNTKFIPWKEFIKILEWLKLCLQKDWVLPTQPMDVINDLGDTADNWAWACFLSFTTELLWTRSRTGEVGQAESKSSLCDAISRDCWDGTMSGLRK
jgi:hypothetical protein